MNIGGGFKAKPRISNYLNKQKYKPKNNSNSTSNNTIISEKDTNQPIDSFRKGSVRENCSKTNKFKTGENSPERFLFNQDQSKNLRSLSGKHKDLGDKQNMEIKSILSTSKIKTMLKESIGVDCMFKKKIQMMHKKKLKHDNSQMTYSNIYSHNSTKSKVNNSLYQKGSKNESFVKKPKIDCFDDEAVLNLGNSNSNKAIIAKAKNCYEQDLTAENNSKAKNKSNQPEEEMKVNKEGNLGISNYIDIYFGNGYSNGSSKAKQTPNQSGSLSNANQTYKKHNSLISKSNILVENNFINSTKNSDSNILGEVKKAGHKPFPSKNTLRKTSTDRAKQVYVKNGPNLSASTVKMKIFQDDYKEKNINAQTILINSHVHRSSSSSFQQKGSQDLQVNKQFHPLSNAIQVKEQLSPNEAKPAVINLADSITPSPRISSTRLTSSLKVFTNSSNSNVVINPTKPSPSIIQGPSTKSQTNISEVKYNEYVLSNQKNSSSTKNTQLQSNPVLTKNEDSEKDIFLAKLKANQKHKKPLTTVQSKQNSKSNSRVEDYFNFPFSKKPNAEMMHLGVVTSSDKMKNHSIIANKKSVPITMCQSPIGKSTQEILKKINVNKSPQLEQLEMEKKAKKASLLNGFEAVKRSLESIDTMMNKVKYEAIKSNEADLEQMLNETCESIQSTAREAVFYRRECDRISTYIREYYRLNKVYPPSKMQFYRCGRLIGKGAFGKVNLALHVCSGRLVALKSFNKAKNASKHSKSKIANEIEMLRQCQHPFVSQILDVFETEKHHVIVMEYICGDLFSFIRKRSKISEAFSKVIFKQIIEGLKHIHQNHIVHRDIKLDNILIDLDNTVKICDFGVSRKVTSGTIMHDHCGTPAYIAPEIFLRKGYQGYSCDIWSAGVTLYYMLSGSQPFKANNLSDLHSVIISGKYEKIESISLEARDLIDGMLQVDPKKRMTIPQILSHPWINSVDIKNRGSINLFTTAERVLLGKYNIDYLNSHKDDLIEQFTLKNLDTQKEEEMNGNTKSHILAPFNSMANVNDSSLSLDIQIENDISKFCGRVKQLNIKYELNNNKQFDNGVIITQQESEEQKEKGDNKQHRTSSSDKYSSKPLSPQVELEEIDVNISKAVQKEGNGNIDENALTKERVSMINDSILIDIEQGVGYKKKYLMNCLEKKEVNYATATYYLLNRSKYA